ncbi:MAG: hypothetical protein KME14_20510 [Tildeniella torsiva UHER 1998/13D]|jgi:hypothetical protein|nr:hypothetical protein [Tildeniella torsiva UHER 1998/13D]
MAIRKLGGFWNTFQYGLQVFAEHSSGLGVLINFREMESGLVLRIVVQRQGPGKTPQILSTTEIEL